MEYNEKNKAIVLESYRKVIEILGINEINFQFKIDTDNQLKIINLYKELTSQMGFNKEILIHWLKTPNKYFIKKNNPTAPLDIIVTLEGLGEVIEDLEFFLDR